MEGNATTYYISVDESGHWEKTIDNDLSEGIHAARFISDSGEREAVLFEVVEEGELNAKQSGFSKTLPDLFWYGAILFCFLFLILVLYTVRLGMYADKEEKEKKEHRRLGLDSEEEKEHQYTLTAIIVATVLIIFAIYAFVLMSREPHRIPGSSIFNFGKKVEEVMQKPHKLSGSVIDPILEKGVVGVDLSVGDTRVRTQEGGFYQFGSVYSEEGIEMTHPLLKRKIVLLAPKEKMDVYFDAGLYNVMVDIVDLESRGRISQIFEKKHPDILPTERKSDFVDEYESIYSGDDITNQFIEVNNFVLQTNWKGNKEYPRTFEKAITCELRNDGGTRSYTFVLDKGLWWYAK
ncbi:MAG: hypothetical protein ABII02_02560 [Candidatus Magasanikbacteria bacterium]